MNCKEFQELMYLRDDELADHLRRQLLIHQASCPGCTELVHDVQRTHRMIGIAREHGPTITNPEMLSAEILRQIATADRRFYSRLQNRSIRLIDWLEAPAIRTSLAAALFIIVLSFIFEYTSAYVQIKNLEIQVSSRSATMAAGPVLFDQDASTIVDLVSGRHTFANVGGDWILMKKTTLQDFAMLFSQLNANARFLPPEFHRQYPKLSKLLKQQSMLSNFNDLTKDRAQLIHELNMLIPIGGKKP
jgi:hypothetical protein